MDERHKRMTQLGVPNITAFNARVRHARKAGQVLEEQHGVAADTMPYLAVVVDEFADLMVGAGREIEAIAQRVGRLGRGAGVHLVMATQRPSADIVTGWLKTGFPARIAFKVGSNIESRTILNEAGAEQLLGNGDMLFTTGAGQAVRVHGPMVAGEEVQAVAHFLRKQRNGDPPA